MREAAGVSTVFPIGVFAPVGSADLLASLSACVHQRHNDIRALRSSTYQLLRGERIGEAWRPRIGRKPDYRDLHPVRTYDCDLTRPPRVPYSGVLERVDGLPAPSVAVVERVVVRQVEQVEPSSGEQPAVGRRSLEREAAAACSRRALRLSALAQCAFEVADGQIGRPQRPCDLRQQRTASIRGQAAATREGHVTYPGERDGAAVPMPRLPRRRRRVSSSCCRGFRTARSRHRRPDYRTNSDNSCDERGHCRYTLTPREQAAPPSVTQPSSRLLGKPLASNEGAQAESARKAKPTSWEAHRQSRARCPRLLELRDEREPNAFAGCAGPGQGPMGNL